MNENTRSLKIILLIGSIILGAGILVAEFSFFLNESEQIPQSPPPIAEKTPVVIPTPAPERDLKLQAETDALLSLFDKMPPVPVYVKDEIVRKSGTNTEKGVAYTDCDENKYPSIYVKKVFYRKTNRKQLDNILKHELTHAWLCRQNLMSVGHGTQFQRKFKQVGGWGN